MNTAFLCHGKPKRSFSFRGYQFPLCARCTGIYAGMFISLSWEYQFGLPSTDLIPVFILIIFPTLIDGLIQLVGKRESSNPVRFITGFPAGLGLMFLIRIGRSILL